MKLEIEVPEELVNRLGRSAVETYLTQKAELLNQSLLNPQQTQPSHTPEDSEARDKAWQSFNKRGMSC